MDNETLNLPQIIMRGEITIRKAVSRLNSKIPGIFQQNNVKEIRISPGMGGYAYVTNAPDKAGIIFLDFNRIKSEISSKYGTNQEALEEAIISALEEAIAHEAGHLAAHLEGGEFPAEEKAREAMRLLSSCDLYNRLCKVSYYDSSSRHK